MTLILKLDLDMVIMYLHTKNEVSMSRDWKVIAWKDRNTDRLMDRHLDRNARNLPAGGNNNLCLLYEGKTIQQDTDTRTLQIQITMKASELSWTPFAELHLVLGFEV